MYCILNCVSEYVEIDLNCAYENHLRFPISLFLRPTPPPAVFIVIMAFDPKRSPSLSTDFKTAKYISQQSVCMLIRNVV